jgi:hypothetical protein
VGGAEMGVISVVDMAVLPLFYDDCDPEPESDFAYVTQITKCGNVSCNNPVILYGIYAVALALSYRTSQNGGPQVAPAPMQNDARS